MPSIEGFSTKDSKALEKVLKAVNNKMKLPFEATGWKSSKQPLPEETLKFNKILKEKVEPTPMPTSRSTAVTAKPAKKTVKKKKVVKKIKKKKK